jgi:hypothetical protein
MKNGLQLWTWKEVVYNLFPGTLMAFTWGKAMENRIDSNLAKLSFRLGTSEY